MKVEKTRLHLQWNLHPNAPQPTGVTLIPDTLDLAVGETAQVTVEFEPAGTTDTGDFSSAGPGIADVNENGEVTAIAEGIVTVRFISSNGLYSNTCRVTVMDPP